MLQCLRLPQEQDPCLEFLTASGYDLAQPWMKDRPVSCHKQTSDEIIPTCEELVLLQEVKYPLQVVLRQSGAKYASS